MIDWIIQIEHELQRVQPNENPGRTRTTSRRIAGIALQKYYGNPAEDFILLINKAVDDDVFPEDVRSALQRLAARIDANFRSPSIDPLNDAMIVVDHVKKYSTKEN